MEYNLLPVLVECIITFMKSLIRLYDQGYIDYSVFETCSAIKLEFLKNNIGRIEDPGIIKEVNDIIDKSETFLARTAV